MTSTFMTSNSTTQRRSTVDSHSSSNPPVIYPDVDPAPRPKLIAKLVAVGAIVVFALLQLLPATHFRDPSDPFRKWIPVHSKFSSSLDQQDALSERISGDGDGLLHIVSWMDCSDLRMLAVLANSSLSNTRYPEMIYFHFFTPGGHNDRVSYYKLKVLFPHSNLEIIGLDEVKGIIESGSSKQSHSGKFYKQVIPFVIPTLFPKLRKFVYVPPNVIMKGRIEEVIGADMGNFGIAVVEECSKKLNAYVSADVLRAVQRSTSKPWASKKYDVDEICIPDMSLLLIDAKELNYNLVESILWWSEVLDLNEREGNAAVVLALDNKYYKLPTIWSVKNAKDDPSEEAMAVRYHVPRSSDCFGLYGNALEPNGSAFWRQFLPSNSGLLGIEQ